MPVATDVLIQHGMVGIGRPWLCAYFVLRRAYGLRALMILFLDYMDAPWPQVHCLDVLTTHTARRSPAPPPSTTTPNPAATLLCLPCLKPPHRPGLSHCCIPEPSTLYIHSCSSRAAGAWQRVASQLSVEEHGRWVDGTGSQQP